MMTRFVRLFKADVHGVMDQLEDRNLVLKQCLREMEASLSVKRAEAKRMAAALEDARERLRGCAEEISGVETDLTTAIEREKDDIARFLIKRLKPLSRHREALERHIAALERDLARFEEEVAEQSRQYESLRLKAEEHARRSARQAWDSPLGPGEHGTAAGPVAEEEIELELMRRKAARKEGVA